MSDILKIDFPKKYSIDMVGTRAASISVPPEFRDSLIENLQAQSWIAWMREDSDNDKLHVGLSQAYEFSEDELKAALGRICEHVMNPQDEVDLDVWGEVLADAEDSQPSAMDS